MELRNLGDGDGEERGIKEDERIVVLEEIMYLSEEAMKGLKIAYETAEDEKLKLKLTGGISVFEFIINMIKHKIELLDDEAVDDES